jgi:hypothetical protein
MEIGTGIDARFAPPPSPANAWPPKLIGDTAEALGDRRGTAQSSPSLEERMRKALLSWARDELAIEELAARTKPGLRRHSRLDEVLAALERFDPAAAAEYRSAARSIRAGSGPAPLASPALKGLRHDHVQSA